MHIFHNMLNKNLQITIYKYHKIFKQLNNSNLTSINSLRTYLRKKYKLYYKYKPKKIVENQLKYHKLDKMDNLWYKLNNKP